VQNLAGYGLEHNVAAVGPLDLRVDTTWKPVEIEEVK
jgi:hypothetical protein